MNKDDYILENNDEKGITLSLIKKSINNIIQNKINDKEGENQINLKNSKNLCVKDINNILNTLKKTEIIIKNIYKNQNIYKLFKRNFVYLNKLTLIRAYKVFKNSKTNKTEVLLSFNISLLKNFINKKSHNKIKRILLTMMRLSIEDIFPSNTFIIIIEIFLNILITILDFNQDNKYSLNDEPFTLINDIIESLITYSKKIKNINHYNYILNDVIDLFEKYLIIPYYPNICFKESEIWLKFLEIHMLNPLKEFETDNNNKNLINKDNNDMNNIENIQKKLYLFLTKIYYFSMRDEYFQSIIIPKGIINLEYYIIALNYLTHLFQKEEKLQSTSSFKINNGFHLQKDNFLFLPDIKLKQNEFSIIFSFKIEQIQRDITDINILNIYQKQDVPILNLSVDENNYLYILYNGDKKWNTFIKIKENKFYLVCIYPRKNLLSLNSKLCLFINESINEKIIKNEQIKCIEIQGTDSCFYYKKKINLDSSKEISLELGKNNFIGVIGEFLIINKYLKKTNIQHLFNLKENYAKVLSQIFNNYEKLYKYDSPNFIKSKFGINKLSDKEKRSIEFFKQLGFNIILEIMTYKINRFNKMKYFSKNYQNQLNSSLSSINIRDNGKENNEKNLSLISILTMRSENSLNNFSCISENSNSISNNYNNSYIYQKDAYKQEKIDININLFKIQYSSISFYQNKGIDFLTFQLHNILSTIEDQKILETYLYESISFIYKFMLVMNENLIDISVRQSPKIDNKISVFFLTLLTLLIKKEKKILNNDIILRLIEILDFFRFNQLYIQRNIIISILLEVDYYKKQSDIMKYPKLFKIITSDLEDSNYDTTIINQEILYKILLLDFIFETKEYNHKLLIKLISAFISFDKYKKNDNSENDTYITDEFIKYILGLNNEIKIYHYLKIIYLNSSKIIKKLIKNDKFLEYINMKTQKINYNHCKYCAYNQILCFLINEEIVYSSSENDYCFYYNPTGFMKNPSIYFIKSIFAQFLSISNENKLKFIKTKLEGIEFILSILKNEKKNKNKVDDNTTKLEDKFAHLVGYNKFIPRFKALIDYIKFLFEELKESNDNKLLSILNDTITFIMNFMQQICLEKKKNIKVTKKRSNWSIISKDDNINNIINTSEKHSKENRLTKIYDDFIKDLLSCKGMKNFYYIYLSINYKQALEDIKIFFDISIYDIYNPFYFYLLSSNLDYDNEINNRNISTNDEINIDEKINQYIKCQLLSLLGIELTTSKINFDDSKDIILVQNNILLLIYIYHNLINKKIEISVEFEKFIILFLNYLIDNFYIYCKYSFNINYIIGTNIKDVPNKKFIIEIIVDILFILYDNTNYDLKYNYLIKGIFKNNKKNLIKIDEQYFLESKNKESCFKFFNQNYLHNICKGTEVPEILFTIYFLYYLCEKMNKYKISSINNDNTEPIKLLNEILSDLISQAIQIYDNYYQMQKIILIRKNLINKYPYKIYKHFMIFIADKYKEKDLTLDNLMAHYDKLIVKKDINFERKTHFINEELCLKNYNSVTTINNRGSKLEVIQESNTWKQSNRIKEIQIPDGSISLSKNSKCLSKSKSKFQNRVFVNMKNHNLENRLKESKRSKSFSRKYSSKFLIKNYSMKSSKHFNQLVRRITLDYSDSESEKENNDNIRLEMNEYIGLLEDKKDEKDNIGVENIIVDADENKNINNNLLTEINKINENENNKKEINMPEKSLISRNTNLILDNEDNDIFNKDNIIKERKQVKFEIPLSKTNTNNNDNTSDTSEEESSSEEYDIKKKLKIINIPSRYYRNIFHLSDSKTMNIFFNPKEYYFWNIFTLILKKMIFHHKKFDIISKIYNMTFKKLNLKKNKHKYSLKYPTKLKNFICDDYYRPFIKPDIYFFKHKLLPNTLPYLNKKFFNNNFSDEDNLCKIKFERILPINYDIRPTKKIVCEIINNNGSIFGHIYFNHAFLLFISDSNNDPRNEKNKTKINEKQDDFYLYSYFTEDRLKNKKKYVIMYFSEIKEILIRRFCLNYVGYEIFMKDNKSHLFNFFNKKNLTKFIHIICEKLELSYKNKQNTNNPMIYSHNENILSLPILNFNINNDINFSVINDPSSVFEKNGYKIKYQKGEISNFKYLLLINKYSSRSYKDNNQYLIFPLLFMDTKRKINRDLSKAICLNKTNNEESVEIFKENFKSCGNHFNTHYSSCGYILYYLVRLIPFTFGHIKLQSGHFDAPERIFSSFENYISALTNSDENRELCPELFFICEAFINLNHYSLGYIKSDKFFIDDFSSNDENGIIGFIISSRQSLEKANIIPWIDNIFGSNQTNENDELINIFPLSSYEQFNNFEEMKKKLERKGLALKEIINQIKSNIDLLSLGVTPVQLFKANHPLKNISTKRLFSFFDGNNNINYYEKIVKTLSYKNLNNFINTNMVDKYQIFSIENENNNYGMKLIIKSQKNMHILKMYNNDNNKNNSIIKLELWKKKQIKIEPLSQICCELSPGIFCFCRYIDNVIQIKSEKQCFLYQYKFIITSVEFFSHNETKNTANNTTLHSNEILFGDEQGNLNLMQIEYEVNNKKQTFQIISDKIKIAKQVKVHNSFIQGILYVKRLNIIISYSEEGQITINNAYSFSIINIIELGEKYYIKDIKISNYDLIYINCFNNINKKNYIKCYTLNGIKATKLKTDKKIHNFFVTEEVIVIYDNNIIEAFNLYDLSCHPIYVINPEPKTNDKDDRRINAMAKDRIIAFCDFIIKDMKMIIIYQDNEIIIQDIFPLEK